MNNDLGKDSILLLDDNNHNLDLLSSLISDDFFSKSLVKTGAAAIRVAHRVNFALAILDINLPDINGLDVARKIKTVLPECEIIFCSAYSDRVIREKAFEAGGIDYIEKPFEVLTTRQRIRNQTDKILLRKSLQVEKQRLEKMISSMVDAVVTTDLTDKIVSFNNAAEKIFKVSAEDVLGKNFSQFVPPSLRKRHASALQNFKAGKSVGIVGSANPTQLKALTATGDQINIELILSSWEEQNTMFVTAIIRDISKQKALESSLAELSSALNESNSMVGRYSRIDDDYLWMTDRFAHLQMNDQIKSQINLIVERSFIDLDSVGDASQLHQVEATASDGSPSSYLVQALPAKSSEELIVFATETSRLTYLQRQKDALLDTVRTDELTGCLSRRAFLDDFENERRIKDYVIGLLDVDYFKSINDYYGHDVGDLYLHQMAKTLSSTLMPDDILARLGGEEFVVAFPTGSKEQDESHLEMIRQRVSEFELASGGRTISRSVSIGATQLLQCQDLTKALAIADECLQLAKSSGRNRVVFFDHDNNDGKIMRVRRPSHEMIKAAFRSGKIYFDYQNVFDVRRKEIVGYEALVRMRDRNHQVVPPKYFLDEYYHLSNNDAENMSRASLFRTYLDLMKHQEPGWVSYNIRGSDLIGKNFSELIELCSPVNCGVQVCLELSEEEISDRIDLPALHRVLEDLKAHGFKIYLDDFGKERSNFHRLVELPFDVIKLDRVLVQGLGVSEKAEKLIAFLTGLTKEFEMLLVAEGVETELQAEILHDNNLYLHQGFLYGRPKEILKE